MTISSDADSMKFVTVCNPIAGFEPASPSSSGRVTFAPEGQINRLYSSNLKPQVTVVMIILKGVVLLVVKEAHEK